MAFKGQFTYGIPVTAINIVDALPDNAVIPASVVDSRKGPVVGIALGDLKSQVGSTHYVGEEFGGGVVFHVYKDANGEEHGLIVSENYLSSAYYYSNVDSVASGATSTWDGQSNTNLLSAQAGATDGAWKLCVDYSYDGYDDWYLPAIDELVLLFNNRFNVNQTLQTIIGSDLLTNKELWSSTESNPVSAWYSLATLNYNGMNNKSTPSYGVRAVRKF